MYRPSDRQNSGAALGIGVIALTIIACAVILILVRACTG
jgi:hypothetical protein